MDTKGGEYSLKWNSHKLTVMSAFTNLFENEKHADCTLAAEGKTVKAHKVMISACSPYLEKLLEEHSKEKGTHPILIFNDLTFFELKALCEYMYKGEVNVPKENLDSFLKVARCMQVRGLCDGGGGDSIGGDKSKMVTSPDKRKIGETRQFVAKRKRQDGQGFESDTSADNISFVSSPRGRGKQLKTTAKIVAACPPRVVQEVKTTEAIKQEEPDAVYEETVYQDLTFEEEIYQDSNQEPGTSANETIEFANWNDGNTADFNQDSASQEQGKVVEIKFEIVCAKCGRKYMSEYALRRHLKYECGQEPLFACTHCEYETTHKSSLKRHLIGKHNYKEDEITCDQCNKKYKSVQTLRRHRRYECGQVAKFSCPLCPYKAKQPNNLKKHIGFQHGIEYLQNIEIVVTEEGEEEMH